jgi:hypothetical protein
MLSAIVLWTGGFREVWHSIRAIGVVGGTSLVATSVALASAAVASASPSVVGMTFDKAQEAVQDAGLTAEVSTTTGTALPQSECIVVNQVVRAAVTFGREYTPTKMLLSLNCNATLATAGHPGNSAASPEGQLAKEQQEAEAWRRTPDGQAWCQQAQQKHPDWFPLEGCPT